MYVMGLNNQHTSVQESVCPVCVSGGDVPAVDLMKRYHIITISPPLAILRDFL